MQAIGPQPQRALDGAPVHYERHRPEKATLHRLVQLSAKGKHALWRNVDLLHLPHGACIHARRRAKAAAGP